MMYPYVLLATIPTIISAFVLDSVNDLTSNSGEDLASTSDSLVFNNAPERTSQGLSSLDTDSSTESPDRLLKDPEIDQDLASVDLSEPLDSNIVESSNQLLAGTDLNECTPTRKREVGQESCILRLQPGVDPDAQNEDTVQGEDRGLAVPKKPYYIKEVKCMKGETPLCCELKPPLDENWNFHWLNCQRCM